MNGANERRLRRTLAFWSLLLVSWLPHGTHANTELAEWQSMRLSEAPPFVPTLAVWHDDMLYATEESDDVRCSGGTVYRKKLGAEWKKVVGTPACILRLFVARGAVLGEALGLEGKRKGNVYPFALQGEKALPLEEALPSLDGVEASGRLALHRFSGKWNEQNASELRRSLYRQFSFGSEDGACFVGEAPAGSWRQANLLCGVRKKSDEPFSITALPLAKPGSLPRLTLDHWPSVVGVVEERIEGKDAVAASRKTTVNVWDAEAGSRLLSFDEVAKRPFGSLDALAGSDQKRVFFRDREEARDALYRLVALDLASKEISDVAWPTRDFTGLGRSAEGVLLLRRAGIDWYAPKAVIEKGKTRFPLAVRGLPETLCDRYRWVERHGKKELYVYDKGESGTIELVPLGRFEKASFECRNGALLVVGTEFEAFRHEGFTVLSFLTPKNEGARGSNARNAAKAAAQSKAPRVKLVEGKDTALLYGFYMRELRWVRAPFAKSTFGKVSVLPDQSLRVELLGDEDPYDYDLRVTGPRFTLEPVAKEKKELP